MRVEPARDRGQHGRVHEGEDAGRPVSTPEGLGREHPAAQRPDARPPGIEQVAGEPEEPDEDREREEVEGAPSVKSMPKADSGGMPAMPSKRRKKSSEPVR
jgi:hypothetical protein